MAENQSFWRAIEAIGRGLLAPISLLAMTCLVIVIAPSSDNRSADAVSASPSMVCSGSSCTWTFPFTGDYYEWTAPAGVTQVGFDVYGAQGGHGGTSGGLRGNGGLGGRVVGKLAITPGAVYRIYVGGKGTDHSLSGAASFNGGGSTSATSDDNRRPGGGGGASDIRSSSTLASRLVIAGGGGGASGWTTANGGAGGGLIGEAAPGPYHCGSGGKGGTQSAGGASGSCASQVGSLGVGGNGQGGSHGGGGGGGGYFGGGGARVDGGGGGSSFTSPTLTSDVVHSQAARTGAGLVVLTMLRPAVSSFAATVSSPSNQSANLTYNLQFSESVTGLVQSEIMLSGTSNGWSISSFSGSDNAYVVALVGSNVTSGSVILTVAQDAVTSAVTSQIGPALATASSIMNIDIDAPTASFSSTPSSPASAMSLTFGIAFSESVLGISSVDFTNAGTSQGCVFTPSATSGTSVNVVVTQCQEGTLQLQLASGGVVDAAGNTGPSSPLQSSAITLAASSLAVTAASHTVNFGGTWADSFSQSGLIGSDAVTVTYSYSGTTTDGSSYGPSGTKPSSAGSYVITPAVVYGGANANRYSLTRTNGTLTISRIGQSALTVSSTSATYGSNLTLTSSGGSGSGSVSWQVVSGTCSVDGATLTPDDAGSSCVVRATKAQDTNYNAVSSSNTTVTIARSSQSALTVSSTSATYGSNLTLTSSGGSGSGSVSWQVVSGTCSVDGATLTPGNAGSSCVVRATKAQDTNYNAVNSANTTITTNRATQSGFFITNLASFVTGSNLSMTASGGQSGGSISWSLTSGICVLSGTTLTATRGGVTCTIEATRAGNSNYQSILDSMSITVDKIVQGLTFQSTPPSSPVVGGTYTVSVTSDASLAPTVSVANSSSSVCSIAAGVVSFLSPGSCLITASQAGNDEYASAAASQQISVTAVPTTTIVPVTAPNTGADSAAGPLTSSTVPTSGGASVTPVTTPTSTTTTTTTTTVPNNSTGQGDTEVTAGEATAIVRGKRVKVDMKTVNGQLVVRLPNNVTVQVGAPKGSTSSASVNSDGVLVAQTRDDISVGASGFEAGSTYTVTMFSTPVELGRGSVPESGAVSEVVTIPNKTESGEHTLVLEGVGPDAEVVAVSIGFKVLERSNNTWAAVTAIVLAIGLALLSGRPILRRRRKTA